MSGRTLRLAAGLGGLLATAAFGFGIVQAALAQSEPGSKTTGALATAAAPAMPMEQVLGDLKAQGYGEIYEIEREHGKYDIKARNQEGRMVELELDAATGKTLRIEDEDETDRH